MAHHISRNIVTQSQSNKLTGVKINKFIKLRFLQVNGIRISSFCSSVVSLGAQSSAFWNCISISSLNLRSTFLAVRLCCGTRAIAWLTSSSAPLRSPNASRARDLANRASNESGRIVRAMSASRTASSQF
jgi:hypothetical protein